MTTKTNTDDGEIIWQTVEEAAPHLRLSAQGLYAAVRENQLRPDAVLKIGRRIRINLAALLPESGDGREETANDDAK